MSCLTSLYISSSIFKKFINWQVFEKVFIPQARAFRPELILISAGFDAHRDDPLASLDLTEHSYVEMTRRLKEIAKDCANERIVSVLEGGYNLEALARSVEAHLRTLME